MQYNNTKIQAKILDILKQKYGFSIISLLFLPIGEASFSYLVKLNSGKKFFAKYCRENNVVKNIDNINRLLLELNNLQFIISPVGVKKATSFSLGNGKVCVYPFIEGQIIRQPNDQFDKELVDRLTQIMATIHNSTKSINIPLIKEDFKYDYTPRYKALIRPSNKERFDADIWLLLQDNKVILYNLIKKHIEIAKQHQKIKPKLVLTHGDITGLNIIRSNEGLKLTDWDGAYFAPKERDLIFLIDNPHFEIKKYYQLTGEKNYDSILVEYYKQGWSLNSMIGNFESLLQLDKLQQTKQDYVDEINQYLGYYK